jgi:hypothetical protein
MASPARSREATGPVPTERSGPHPSRTATLLLLVRGHDDDAVRAGGVSLRVDSSDLGGVDAAVAGAVALGARQDAGPETAGLGGGTGAKRFATLTGAQKPSLPFTSPVVFAIAPTRRAVWFVAALRRSSARTRCTRRPTDPRPGSCAATARASSTSWRAPCAASSPPRCTPSPPTWTRRANSWRPSRLIQDGFPTGVKVSPAMVHGGPWPATTDSRHASVGSTSIRRFLRPVCCQGGPADRLGGGGGGCPSSRRSPRAPARIPARRW